MHIHKNMCMCSLTYIHIHTNNKLKSNMLYSILSPALFYYEHFCRFGFDVEIFILLTYSTATKQGEGAVEPWPSKDTQTVALIINDNQESGKP